MSLLKKLVDTEYRELRRCGKIADQIEALEDKYSKMSDEELASMTGKFKEELSNGKTLEDIKVDAFAVAREACYRKLGEKPFRVQIIGGLAIHYGNIAEMKTGEGKTITTVLPAYLNALSGKGVHVVTVNEYLSARNAEWMGPIYKFLGLTVGVNLRELSPEEKQAIYNCDITYSTNNEIGFDYLRDNMVQRKEDRVQRGLNYVILDEVDSMLIDEARTPLIISGGKFNSANLYMDADKAVKKLTEETDYIIDEKTKTVMLTAEGSKKIEKEFKLNNLYDADNTALVHHVNQALKANYGMKVDVDYVVDEEGAVIIVDQFTGRLMYGREFSEGLHQAIEAKEGVQINTETKTMATITFQNLFRMYNKLAGMTGTAKTEAEEFRAIYNMYVIEIPTNKPVIRIDYPDLVYPTKKGKYNSIVDYVKKLNATHQPILIGTISVESNEELSLILKHAGLKHEILNAKNHEREAEIIAKAGEIGAITLATNMAGRGTDIKLGEGVKEKGGLCVIGTERHESRRIDNQLRGRAGRQGDPGMSQFFVSFEDDLMRRFGTDRIKMMLQSLGVDDDMAIRSKTLTKSIETAQKRVEGNNYDMRKSLLDYDNIVSEQREIIYARRNEIIESDDVTESIYATFESHIAALIDDHIPPEGYLTDADIEDILEEVNNNLLRRIHIEDKEIKGKKPDEVIDYITDIIKKDDENKLKEVPKEVVNECEKAISLRVIDSSWVEHISTMEQLREGIGLRGYGQINPLQAYTEEGFNLFDKLQDGIDAKVSMFLLKAQINQNIERKQTMTGRESNHDDSLKNTPVHVKKVGRNDPCPCGSGKKYKNCCGK